MQHIHPRTATHHRPFISKVFVWHPSQNACIFSLNIRQCPIAADGSLSTEPCIPLDVVLDAGAIVTGSYSAAAILCRERDGTRPVTSHLLGPGNYYFIPDPDQPSHDYPVYRNFNHWKPPSRQEIPERWFTADVPRRTVFVPEESWIGSQLLTKSNVTHEARVLDRGCILSGNRVAAQVAHFVPVSQADWFHHHNIISRLCFPYSFLPSLDPLASIEDIRNLITLRSDLHIMWDAYHWTLVPYAGSFIAYDFSWPNQNFEWHCARANMPVRADGYLLFLRFALLIFDCINLGSVFPEPEGAVYIPSVSSLGKRVGSSSPGRNVRPRLSYAEEGEEAETKEGATESSRRSENNPGSSVSTDEAIPEGPTAGGDLPRLLASRYEACGYLLPDDLAAVWSRHIDENYEQRKCDWFAEHPQIRSIADPAKVATSSAGSEAAAE
ncbi:hypothetical protein OE88DRAFT_1666287 [Heliocybe sulcata]|uniref:HNH nuclease domain-containing protein n=1 Tax=Heliocybe sulcata TaxID=5364 RepID=A0A5C3MQ06_9AGAM|nr:hypothetical protein OE88DRAFT_1666287 [Heliocybe sulcata]